MTTSKSDPARRSADSRPEEAGDGTTQQKIKQEIKDAKREVGAKARKKAEAGQHRLAEEADALSDAIDAAAATLDDNDRQGLARYTREMSRRLAEAAGHLEGRSLDELADDAKRLARENPALFMLGSVAVGFGLSRFFKASGKHQDRSENEFEAERNEGFDRDDRNEDRAAGRGLSRPETGKNDPYMTPAAARSGDGRNSP